MSTIQSKLSVRQGQRSRDSLLRGIKHELRTPLNAILGFADLLLGELDGPLNPDERENVQMVRESGELLLGLINDVLDLATALVQPSPLYLEDVDEVFNRAVKAGAKALEPVKDQFYGDRSGTLLDPFGHWWTVATHVEDVSQEEMARRAQALSATT